MAILRLFPLFMLTFLGASAYGLIGLEGISDKCDSEVEELVTSSRTRFVLRENRPLIKQYNLIPCQDIPTEVVVALHEGVHFTDLNIAKYKKPPQSVEDGDISLASIFLLDQSRISPPALGVPSPYEVLNPLFADSGSELGAILRFQDFYQEYMADQSMLSARFLLVGFVTEMNAYTHGALTSYEISTKLNKKLEMLSVQRSGMIFFLSALEIYLRKLEATSNAIHASLVSSVEAKLLIAALVENAARILEETQYCSNRNPEEIKQASALSPILNFEALNKMAAIETLGNIAQNLLCKK